MGREKEYTEFMARCKLARRTEDMEEYAPYAKFYVPLYLHELEKSGKLKYGEKKLEYDHLKNRTVDRVWDYKG